MDKLRAHCLVRSITRAPVLPVFDAYSRVVSLHCRENGGNCWYNFTKTHTMLPREPLFPSLLVRNSLLWLVILRDCSMTKQLPGILKWFSALTVRWSWYPLAYQQSCKTCKILSPIWGQFMYQREAVKFQWKPTGLHSLRTFPTPHRRPYLPFTRPSSRADSVAN